MGLPHTNWVPLALTCLAGSLGVLLLATSTPIIWILLVTLVVGVALSSANQTTLYLQAAADQIGTAGGLFRTFGYIGSIASSAIISVAFHTRVSDHHLHAIAWIMVAVSLVGLILVVTDRQLMRQVGADRASAFPGGPPRQDHGPAPARPSEAPPSQSAQAEEHHQ